MPSPLLEPRIGSTFPFDVLNVDFDPRCFTPEVQIAGGVVWDDVVDVLASSSTRYASLR